MRLLSLALSAAVGLAALTGLIGARSLTAQQAAAAPVPVPEKTPGAPDLAGGVATAPNLAGSVATAPDLAGSVASAPRTTISRMA